MCTYVQATHTHTYEHVYTHILTENYLDYYISSNLLHCEHYHKQTDLSLKLPCGEHGLLQKVKLDYENAIYDIP